jgi:hypothetical protein
MSSLLQMVIDNNAAQAVGGYPAQYLHGISRVFVY